MIHSEGEGQPDTDRQEPGAETGESRADASLSLLPSHPPASGPVDLRASWNRLSSYYQRHYRIGTQEAHWGVFAPDEGQLRLLGDVAGKRLLEIGCGGGQCSVAFARAGAICTGVDLSDEQIAYACVLAEQEDVPVTFQQGDMIAFLYEQPAACYDIVFSAYALQYVEDLAGCFRQVARVLKPGGVFAFSLDHPLSDVTEVEDGKTVFAQSYFDTGRMDWDWPVEGGERVPFRSFHRTMSELVNLISGAGLVIERMLEPEPTDESDVWAGPEEMARYAVIPATVIFRARKPG